MEMEMEVEMEMEMEMEMESSTRSVHRYGVAGTYLHLGANRQSKVGGVRSPPASSSDGLVTELCTSTWRKTTCLTRSVLRWNLSLRTDSQDYSLTEYDS